MCGGVHSGPQIAPRANCIARSASLNLNIVEYIEHMLKFKEDRLCCSYILSLARFFGLPIFPPILSPLYQPTQGPTRDSTSQCCIKVRAEAYACHF